MSTLSERWKNTSRPFRILLLLLLSILLLLLCLLVFLQVVLPIINPPEETPTPTTPPPSGEVRVDFSSATYSVREDMGTATITVTLSNTSDLAVAVDYTTAGDTATAGQDYTAATGTLTFDPGVTSQTFTVAIIDDSLAEEDETVMLTLENASNTTVGRGEATLTILDNEPPTTMVTVGFDSPTYEVDEDAGTATVAVTLDAESDSTVTVDYETFDGTAEADEDYTAAGGTLTFAPGITNQAFIVIINNDDAKEGDETITLALSNASNATIDGGEATLTIRDDDDGGTPIPPTETVVDFSSATYSAGEGAGAATITVTLNSASDSVVTVDYATSDGTATADEDYTAASGTLSFDPGDISQTFTVPITDDTLLEGDETVTLTLSDASNATIGDKSPATLSILEDDGVIEIRNVLRNGDFEAGFQPNELGKYWNSFDNGSADFSFHIDDWSPVVVEGEYTQLIEIKNAVEPDRYFGIYQTADVIPDETYTFSMRGLVRTNTGDVEQTEYGYRLQVGFDLSGGQDWEAVEDWVELPWDEQLRMQDSFRVDEYNTTLTAESDKLTVFIRAWKKWADAGEGDYDVDDIRLVGPTLVAPSAPAVPVTGGEPPAIWDNVRIWATIALLLLLLGGAAWRFGWKRA